MPSIHIQEPDICISFHEAQEMPKVKLFLMTYRSSLKLGINRSPQQQKELNHLPFLHLEISWKQVTITGTTGHLRRCQ